MAGHLPTQRYEIVLSTPDEPLGLNLYDGRAGAEITGTNANSPARRAQVPNSTVVAVNGRNVVVFSDLAAIVEDARRQGVQHYFLDLINVDVGPPLPPVHLSPRLQQFNNQGMQYVRAFSKIDHKKNPQSRVLCLVYNYLLLCDPESAGIKRYVEMGQIRDVVHKDCGGTYQTLIRVEAPEHDILLQHSHLKYNDSPPSKEEVDRLTNALQAVYSHAVGKILPVHWDADSRATSLFPSARLRKSKAWEPPSQGPIGYSGRFKRPTEADANGYAHEGGAEFTRTVSFAGTPAQHPKSGAGADYGQLPPLPTVAGTHALGSGQPPPDATHQDVMMHAGEVPQISVHDYTPQAPRSPLLLPQPKDNYQGGGQDTGPIHPAPNASKDVNLASYLHHATTDPNHPSYIEACSDLGHKLLRGDLGYSLNPEEGVRLLTIAASAGEPKAKATLEQMATGKTPASASPSGVRVDTFNSRSLALGRGRSIRSLRSDIGPRIKASGDLRNSMRRVSQLSVAEETLRRRQQTANRRWDDTALYDAESFLGKDSDSISSDLRVGRLHTKSLPSLPALPSGTLNRFSPPPASSNSFCAYLNDPMRLTLEVSLDSPPAGYASPARESIVVPRAEIRDFPSRTPSFDYSKCYKDI
ncbi:hypothetical protein DIPPA_60411 [Diplonema papillatum]|nr:hypothetical protein DIPPA_60411 [Diplonema papillatum]